jgi:chromosome segregation ATPase
MATAVSESIETQLDLARARVTRLTAEHADAKRTLRLAAEDDSGSYDFQALKSCVTRLAHELDAASDEVLRLERESEQEKRRQAEAEFPDAVKECSELREAFLTHRREACIALGKYFPALARCYGLSNRLAHEMLGPLPQFLNPCKELELGNSPRESLSDLRPDMDQHWQTVYEVRPLYENSPTGEQSK